MKKLTLLLLMMLNITIDNYSQTQLTNIQSFEIFANDHFKISNENEIYYIKTDKDEWETFCIKLNNPDYYKNNKLSLQIGINNNINLSITSTEANENSEILINETNLNTGLNLVEIDLSKFNLDFDNELFLYFHIQRGEKWKGNLSIQPIYNSVKTSVNKLNAYPNPCKEEFRIKCEEKNGNLLILNSNGAVVENLNIDLNNQIKTNLPSGNYFLLLTTENKQYSGTINIIK